MAATERVYLDLAAAVCARQRLLIIVTDGTLAARVDASLARAGIDPLRYTFVQAPYDDTWLRDTGPITVVSGAGTAVLMDFRFNAWGGKFNARQDDQLCHALFQQGIFGQASMTHLSLVLEGGAIESDGAGTLLLRESSVVDEARNPGLDRDTLGEYLKSALGCERLLWLRHGHLSGDDTDGHIDTLARFADAQTILYQDCDDPVHPDQQELQAMAAELRELRDATGRPYRLVALPWPGDHRDANGRRLPVSYANFLIVNGAVLVPTYGTATDALATRRIERAFPHREVVGIDCQPLIRQNGSLHCITMQLPESIGVGLGTS